ncbi:hypothetical protein G5I_04846 [Acromyrmex echinatior]|uniref:Uncharacterized protein n=1 Tax=Acromyrmex echinatior TaxID=103372 RepID=F4WGQ3_ACREC|nr:hypothetical protein G5I_04846 [Acromyrmex echinatior]
MRENGEGMEGRSDSISQVYARKRISVSRMHLLSPGMWINVRRDAMTSVPLDSANVDPTFSVKELNPFDPGLDLVRFQLSPRYRVGSRRVAKEIRRQASEGQSPWLQLRFDYKFTLGRNRNWRD